METRRSMLLVYLGIFSAGTLLLSNLAATKIWNFFGIPVDGGIIIFPLSYILGDLTIEFSDQKTAAKIVCAGFELNVLAMLVLLLVGELPAYPGWNNQKAYELILGFAPRVILGSLTAYVLSSLANNYLFELIKSLTNSKYFALRALLSSYAAKILDTVIFETIAFAGILGKKDFLKQALFAYVAGVLLETILCPLTVTVAKKIRKKMSPEDLAP